MNADLISLFEEYLYKHLSEFEQGTFKLSVPKAPNKIQVIKNMHSHLAPELYIQISGATKIVFADEKIKIIADELCIIPQSVTHVSKIMKHKDPFSVLIISVLEPGSITFVLASGEDVGLRPQLKEILCYKTSYADKIVNYINELVLICGDKNYLARHNALIGLLQFCFATLLNVLKNDVLVEQHKNLKIRQCQLFVMRKFSNPDLNVNRLAQWLRCNPAYLSHIFYKEVGTSLIRYINKKRLSKAKILLTGARSLNISEIAWACGYLDPGYFTRVFKREVGISPSEYRWQLNS